MQFPPFHVLSVSKRAYHYYAGSKRGVNAFVCVYVHVMLEYRHSQLFTHDGLVAIVIGMHRHGNATRQQFWSRGSDFHIFSLFFNINLPEQNIIQIGVSIFVFYLCKGDCGFASGAPVHRMLCLIYQPVTIHFRE